MTTTPSFDPFVSITRIDKPPIAGLTSPTDEKVKNCFLCGCGTLTSVNIFGRRIYLKQVDAFKAYLGDREAEGLETCANCLQEIKRVWDLHEEIEAIKEDISLIVDRVKVSMPKNGDDSSGAIDKGSESESNPVQPGQGSSSTPIIETVAVSQNSEPEDSCPCYEHPDCEFDIKEEVFRGEADAEVDDLNETQQINPDSGDGYLDHFDSGENIPNPESSSDHNSNRPKRKARVMAEEILRRTVTSEMDQRKMSDEDSDSEYEGSKKESTVSKLGECSSDSKDEAEPESHVSDGQPRKERQKKNYSRQKRKKSHRPNKEGMTPPLKRIRFLCSSCSKELKSQNTWAFHEAAICKVKGWTDELLKEFQVTIHPCPVQGCGRLYAQLKDLTKHSILHTGLRKRAAKHSQKNET